MSREIFISKIDRYKYFFAILMFVACCGTKQKSKTMTDDKKQETHDAWHVKNEEWKCKFRSRQQTAA